MNAHNPRDKFPAALRRLAAALVLASAALLAVSCTGGKKAAEMDPGMPMDEPGKAAEQAQTQPRKEMSGGETSGAFTIDPKRQQLAGVTYDVVRRRDLDRVIRTVGSVEYDESRLSDVTTKFHGWVEKLSVDKTGTPVERGQVLFTLYSPELVAVQQEYLSAWDNYRRVEGSPFPEATVAARRLLEAVRQRLAYWDIPRSHLRELEEDRKILRTLPIHSPTSGYVVEKGVVAGSHVEAGQLLFRLAGVDRVWVLASVYENELPWVRLGQAAEVSLAYLPDQRFSGNVTYVYPYLEPEERTVKVRIELPNRGLRLKPGMYADVELRARRQGVLVVPQSAVLDSGERQLVFLSLPGGRFEPRQVKIGARLDDSYEILAGLTEGTRVVSSSNFLLDAESQLSSGMRQMAH